MKRNYDQCQRKASKMLAGSGKWVCTQHAKAVGLGVTSRNA